MRLQPQATHPQEGFPSLHMILAQRSDRCTFGSHQLAIATLLGKGFIHTHGPEWGDDAGQPLHAQQVAHGAACMRRRAMHPSYASLTIA